MELALDVAAPEFEEAAELGKIRSEVELLPDKALQQIGVVRHPVNDLGSRQPILTKMGDGGHSGLLTLVPAYREHAPSLSPQQQKTGPKQQVSSLSDRVLPTPGRASLEGMARGVNYITTGNVHPGGLFTGSRCLPVLKGLHSDEAGLVSARCLRRDRHDDGHCFPCSWRRSCTSGRWQRVTIPSACAC